MCDNIILLYMFFIIKIIIYIIIPVTLIFIRKTKIFKYILYVDIVLLLIIAFNNYIGRNACINNSSIKVINDIKTLKNNNSMYEENNNYTITPSKNNKLYNMNDLFYYNQNSPAISNQYYKCNNKKVYMNEIGSEIMSFSIAISSLYQKNVDPVKIFNEYKSNYNICKNGINMNDLYNSTMKSYGNILLSEISVNEIESSIKNGGLVIAELHANENSKLTCDSNYIVIYNVDFNNNYFIADPAIKSSSFICPYSSIAYGNIIDSNNMQKTWTLEEIDNESTKYYLVKKG